MSEEFQAGVAAERARVAIYLRRWERYYEYVADRRAEGNHPGVETSLSQAGALQMALGFVISGEQIPAAWEQDPVPTIATAVAVRGAARPAPVKNEGWKKEGWTP